MWCLRRKLPRCCWHGEGVGVRRLRVESELEMSVTVSSASFFEVHVPEEGDYAFGVAYFPEDAPLEIVPLEFLRVEEWRKYQTVLRDGEFCDYLANNGGVRLVTERLQKFLESNRGEEDPIQWLPVTVRSRHELRSYFVMHFPTDLQPLNREATKWIHPWYPRVPVIRKEFVGQHKVFGLRTNGYTFVIAKELRRKLMREFPGCFSFRPLSAA